MQVSEFLVEGSSIPGVRIGGEGVASVDSVEIASVDASTGRRTSTVLGGGRRDAVAVLERGAEAFADWRSTPSTVRARALRAIAYGFRRAADDDAVAMLISRETGKRLVEARAELRFSADYFDLYARLAEDREQAWWPGPGGGRFVRERPVGLVAVLTPWNFPASIPARKIAPALAAGCTVVWKPSEVAPVSSMAVAALIDAELPAGVLGTVTGEAPEIASAWIEDRLIRVVTFTGSTRVGRILAEQCAQTFTRSVLELGGQAPFVIFDDADVESAVDCLMVAKYRNNGQSCLAANRVWAPPHLLDDVVAAYVERTQALNVGDPRDPTTDLGPMALPSDPERLETLVNEAETHGAAVVRGARVDSASGNFVAPAVCVIPDDQARLLHEEVFGPIVAISTYSQLEEVVTAVNASEHGLGAYVCTRDRIRALEFADQIDVGIIGVNTAAPNAVKSPFGGLKHSGWGLEGGTAGLKAFLEPQTTAIEEL